ncbi:MAG: hypothetical protein CML33_02845 [Rhodobacteraceae bacterium]|nr:hypothetical protein [Paracoccaceae bacterium]
MQRSLEILVVAKANLTELRQTLQSIPRGLDGVSVLICHCDIPTEHVRELAAVSLKGLPIRAFEQQTIGLYPAMNELLEKSTGDLIFFLNSGDFFVPEVADILEAIACLPSTDASYIFDTHQRWRGTTYIRSSAQQMRTESYQNLAHQAGWFDGKAARVIRFEETKLVIADRIWVEAVLESCNAIYVQKPIAIHELGGVSNYPTMKTVKYRYKDGGLSELIKESIKLCMRLLVGSDRYYWLMNLRQLARRR